MKIKDSGVMDGIWVRSHKNSTFINNMFLKIKRYTTQKPWWSMMKVMMMVVRCMLLTNNICLILALKNVALNKVTKQSSTVYSGNSDRAVDGNKNTNYASGKSCTHTHDNPSPWWMVDLGQEVTWLNILHSLIVELYPYHFKANYL